MIRGLLWLLVGLLALLGIVRSQPAVDPSGKLTTLAFLGDVMLGGDISLKLRNQPPERFWGNTLPILRRADAVIANLEGPITTHGERWQGSWKMFHFKADPAAVDILRAGNVRFVNLANNHILDYGERGLLDTLQALGGAGIAHAGAGRTLAEASAPRLLDINGLKVGFLSATDNMLDFAATAEKAGTNYVVFRRDSPALDWIGRSVSELKDAGAALIVLSVHWGHNLGTAPSRDFRQFAHAAIERGVDVMHGHSAHVVQGIERYRHGVILYDSGNFIDDYWAIPFRHTRWSFVFALTVENGRPSRLRLVPVLTRPEPTLATGATFQAITRRMKSLCDALGTATVETAEGLEVPLR